MAHIKTSHIGSWDTYHANGPFRVDLLHDIHLDSTIPLLLNRYNDAAATIRGLLLECLEKGQRLRAYGSTWSLSNIAHQKDRMLFNASLNIKMQMDPKYLDAASPYKADNLFFFQCGTMIKGMSEFLFRKRKSLKTSGASNGQTIAGAISTGVHGSALDVGSVQDYVVGLNLITGPKEEDIVYLERASTPALNDAFAAAIKARVIRDDALFNAALVGLGSFGFIHGVVVEAEDLYLLKRYVRHIPRADAIALAEDLNFESSSFRIAGETDAQGRGLRPYHYKLYINPYKASEPFVTEIVYKKPYRTGYPDPVPRIQKAVYKELSEWVAVFAARHRRLIPAIINALRNQAFPRVDEDMEGMLSEIFWDTSQQSAAFGCAVGIDHTDAGKALDVMVKLMNERGPIPGILSMRFVKGSDALLAFTRFPVTCVLEVDGVLWKGNAGMISLEDFLHDIVDALKANSIGFTFHWGKNAAWGYPGLVDLMYGTRDDEWKDLRSGLLTKEMADIFSNDFLTTVQLADYRRRVPLSF